MVDKRCRTVLGWPDGLPATASCTAFCSYFICFFQYSASSSRCRFYQLFKHSCSMPSARLIFFVSHAKRREMLVSSPHTQRYVAAQVLHSLASACCRRTARRRGPYVTTRPTATPTALSCTCAVVCSTDVLGFCLQAATESEFCELRELGGRGRIHGMGLSNHVQGMQCVVAVARLQLAPHCAEDPNSRSLVCRSDATSLCWL